MLFYFFISQFKFSAKKNITIFNASLARPILTAYRFGPSIMGREFLAKYPSGRIMPCYIFAMSVGGRRVSRYVTMALKLDGSSE